MKILVVIPARGGSKGVPRKNIKLLNGKPLIQFTIDAAQNVFDKKNICVSTDDIEIKNIVESLGLTVPFIRPAALSTDTASTFEVLLHALEFYENREYVADTLVLLQATSPFRTEKHIKEALNEFDESCEMLVSVCETKSNPYYVLKEENSQGWLESSKVGDFTRRQDCPKVYELNGAIYIINVKALKEAKSLSEFTRVKKYVMDEQSSHDIDSPYDWKVAEIITQEVINTNR